MKHSLWLVAALAVVACGPDLQGQDVKTPDEIIEEEERAAEEAERKKAAEGDDTELAADEQETDLDKKAKFDEKQADLELKRAARSAETCVGVVTEAGPKGTGKVTLVFGNDGKVTESKIDPPFHDTALGKCVLRAMSGVILPKFVGDPVTKEWEINLTGEKPAK